MTVLEAKNMYKAFPTTDSGINLVLQDINFKAKENEFLSIVGPSGCGKSTLLRLIAGLSPITHGELTLNGAPIEDTDSNRGMVFQNATLFPWRTVEENIRFSQDMKKERNDDEVSRLIDLIGLTGYKDYYPSQLSGGMAQRVSLARTMINRPEVFLLDEPLGALDAFTRANLQDELLKLWQENNNLMIMVTHDVEEAVYMGTKVVVMNSHPGRIHQVVPIDLEYPRDRTSEKFVEYRTNIMKELNF